MQAIWRTLAVPAFILAGLFAYFQAPDTVGSTVTNLGSTVINFITTQPQIASAIVLGLTVLLLSSTIVPLLGAVAVFLLIFAPNQLTRFLPQLPSVPSVPSFLVPGPIKEVR